MRHLPKLLPAVALFAGCIGTADPGDNATGEERLFATLGAGETRYEAEDHSAQSGCRDRRNHGGFTGSGFVDFGGNGTWFELNDVRGTAAGEHELRFRYANGSASNRPSEVLVNGRRVGTLDFTSTGSWSAWRSTSLRASLRSGDNTVRVRAVSGRGGPNVDHLVVVSTAPPDECPNDPDKLTPGACGCGVSDRDSDGDGTADCHDECAQDPSKSTSGRCGCGVPEGTCGGDVDADGFTIEAEDFDASAGCSRASNHPGFTGAGFVDFGGNGSSVTWRVSAAPAQYELTFRYANGSGTNRRSALRVDGQVVGTLDFPRTGSWERWGTQSLSVSLRGAATLQLTAVTGDGGPNLDRLVFTPVGGPPDLCPNDPQKTEPGECGCGTPEGSCDEPDAGPPGDCQSELRGGDELRLGQVVCSPSGEFTLGLDDRGDVVLKRQDTVIWRAGARDGDHLKLQSSDGNLVLYGTDSDGTVRARWASRTSGNPGAVLFVEDAGRAVLKDGDRELWSTDEDDTDGGGDTDPGVPPPSDLTLARSPGAALRIASWNTFRGSVFPKTNQVWRAINTSGKYHVSRTEAAARVFRAVDADIWLLQEVVYTTAPLPSGVTTSDIDRAIEGHMREVTGRTWDVSCNADGLCVMVRAGIRFDGGRQNRANGRVMSQRVVLTEQGNARLLLLNGHYMRDSHAQDTRSLIDSLGGDVDAVFVAGDFNATPGSNRFNTIDNIAGMQPVSIHHWVDPDATHLSEAIARKTHLNTKGYVRWEGGLVSQVSGGHIDHFFLKSGSWRAGNRLTLNTLLLSPDTLRQFDLEPLDIALQPNRYFEFFRDFLSQGVIHAIPDSAYDGGSRGLDHDHLPMIVDIDVR